MAVVRRMNLDEHYANEQVSLDKNAITKIDNPSEEVLMAYNLRWVL